MDFSFFKNFKVLWNGTECNHIAFNGISIDGRLGYDTDALEIDVVLPGREFNHITFNRISKNRREGYDTDVLVTEVVLH